MTYTTSKERARIIRKALVQEFGIKNVSVRKGSGTASSWVEAKVETFRPDDCTCTFTDTLWNGQKALKPYRTDTYCVACKERHNKVSDLVRDISAKAMQEHGYEHSTYYADDGYNSERQEFLYQINVQ